MKAAVFTVSTRAYKAKQESAAGTAVKRVVEQVGFDVKAGVLPEDRTVVEAVLRQLADTGSVQLILTVGSTGVLKKNCAPDRSAAGIRNRTVMVNLPDSGKLAKEGIEFILPELVRAVEMLNV